MRVIPFMLAAASLLAACGQATPLPRQEAAPNSSAVSNATDSRSAFAGRKGELINPDASTMVFLYYELAGLAPPTDRWVEEDRRVMAARGADKAAQRALVKAEIESGTAGIRDVGLIRLSMNAKLSEYDPTYEEFSVRALAPSSVVNFEALRQKVSLSFANARAAQTWRVPSAEAQTVRDKLGYGGATLDVLLQITGVQPGSGSGTIMANVLEYEMRESRSGAVLARVQVPES